MRAPCPTCGPVEWSVVHRGSVRSGRFGESVPAEVWGCQKCGLQWLPPVQADLQRFYESAEYRKSVDVASDVDTFHKLHDANSVRWLGMMDGGLLRNATLADVGCGAGSLLDAVRGYARNIVAIEPMADYHAPLRANGFHVYPYADRAAADWAGKVDVACSFSVIEHVPEPVDFLRDIRKLLHTSGTLYISTPNRNDVLTHVSAEFRAFFYRTHHTFYFDIPSLRAAAYAAGFAQADVRCVHSYSFMNFVRWLRESRPTGNGPPTDLGDAFDAVWRAALEQHGLGDYLWLRCTA
jgi:2-polyprenyl-3-methyl-5-hydroxy-6-metoxy-1,4-benzoquinol methylase